MVKRGSRDFFYMGIISFIFFNLAMLSFSLIGPCALMILLHFNFKACDFFFRPYKISMAVVFVPQITKMFFSDLPTKLFQISLLICLLATAFYTLISSVHKIDYSLIYSINSMLSFQ